MSTISKMETPTGQEETAILLEEYARRIATLQESLKQACHNPHSNDRVVMQEVDRLVKERDAARDLGIEICAPIRLAGEGMKLLLLLSGKAGAGKDTFADSIASLGFHKYSFAKALKDEASRGGWDGAKDERGRLLLQQLGTVWRNYEPEHWIRRLQESIRHDMVVITDCRYRNEISLMKTWGRENGYSVVTVRINRAEHDNGLSPEARSHPSECELDDEGFDMVVENNGTLLQFCIGAREVTKCLLSGSLRECLQAGSLLE